MPPPRDSQLHVSVYLELRVGQRRGGDGREEAHVGQVALKVVEEADQQRRARAGQRDVGQEQGLQVAGAAGNQRLGPTYLRRLGVGVGLGAQRGGEQAGDAVGRGWKQGGSEDDKGCKAGSWERPADLA